MKRNSSFILGPIKKSIIIVLTAIFLILLSFIYMLALTRHREYEDKMIIDVFGEQKTYTQMISKDVSRIYVMMLSLETDHNYSSNEELSQKIVEVNEDLEKVRTGFADNLRRIHNQEISADTDTIHLKASLIQSSKDLKRIDDLWVEFDAAIKKFMDSNNIDNDMAEALIFINNNNIELMRHCDNLQEQILTESLANDRLRQRLAYGLIAVLIIIILAALYQLQHYLIRPFNQLYRGIAEIGLDSYPIQKNYPTKKTIVPIVAEINDMFRKINDLISLIENINNNASFMDTLNFISRTFSTFIPYNYIGIGLISEDKKFMKASYGVSDGSIVGFPEKLKRASWRISETSLGVLIDTGEARMINDLEEYCAGKPLKQYNKILLEAGVRSSIALPLKVSGEPMGVIFFSSTRKHAYTQEHIKFLKTLANSIAISLNQNIFVNDIVFSSILALAKLSEARDEDTGEHLDRMAVYTRTIAELLYENNLYTDEITLEYIDNIERFSPLHDIGKVGIRDGILLKPGKLTTEEFIEMKKHASYGAEVLRVADKNIQKHDKRVFGMGTDIAEGHHEKWDGSGYPYGRKGTEIPLSARIVAIADVFDALTSRRPYKEAFSLETALGIIQEGNGKHFDPVITEVFLKNFSRIESIYHRFKGRAEAETA